MRCQVSPLFVIIMIVIVGSYCYGYSVTIWNRESYLECRVSQPLLYSLHGYAVLQEQASTGVTQVVVTYVSESVVLEQLSELH